MNQVTRILSDIEQGDAAAARELLPLVYDELRKLAGQRMSGERPGQTLQATALVHEAYLRLVDVDEPQRWSGRGHFFAAAAEAMRRILIERARRSSRRRHGGGRKRLDLAELDSPPQFELEAAEDGPAGQLLALDDALNQLERDDPESAALVKLRYFAGLTIEESASALTISVRTANRHWAYAKAWLYRQLNDS
jgi:RNA polymerase sigma factor (TIGR02999 family)